MSLNHIKAFHSSRKQNNFGTYLHVIKEILFQGLIFKLGKRGGGLTIN